MFEINQKVKVVKDVNGEYFIGCEGIIKDIDEDNLVGLEIYKVNKIFASANMLLNEALLYFKEEELELVKESE